MAIRVVARRQRTLRHLTSMQAALLGPQAKGVVATAAWKTHAYLVRITPKGFTGHTRQAWRVERQMGLGYAVTNDSKVMLFLDQGTNAHGPVTAKFLYIPLTSRGANAYAAGNFQGVTGGVDFVFAKWVRGIRARNIVERGRRRAARELHTGMVRFLRRVVRRGG